MTMEKEQVAFETHGHKPTKGTEEGYQLHLTRTGPPKRTKEEADVKTEVTGTPSETPRQDSVSKSREADRPNATHQKCRCNPPNIRRRDKSAKYYKS